MYSYEIMKMRANAVDTAREGLNRLGRQGWRVIHISTHPPELVIILERSSDDALSGIVEKAKAKAEKKQVNSKPKEKADAKEEPELKKDLNPPKEPEQPTVKEGASLTSEII